MERPPIWIGHVTIKVKDAGNTHKFYCELGLRSIQLMDNMAILELRGGTHLLLFEHSTDDFKNIPDQPFDLMVEDVEKSRSACSELGLKPTEMEKDDHGHHLFHLKDPDGRKVTIYSSHTGERPV